MLSTIVLGVVLFAGFALALLWVWREALKAGVQQEQLDETRKRMADYQAATEAYKRAAALPDDDVRERLRRQATKPVDGL